MSIQSINPTTEEVVQTFEAYSDAQVNEALEQAHRAFFRWRDTTFAERGALFHRLAAYLRAHKADLARLATLEMGKPIAEAEAEIEKCALNCDYYAVNAEKFLSDEHVTSNATESYVSYQPLGVVLAVMPWNYPFWQVIRFAAPGMMAGNTAILKHASNVSLAALALERAFKESGFPEGAFRTVLVPGAETGKLIADRRVAAVTLTGSDAAGMAVAGTSGHELKKTVLELGGSDAFIVLEDADLDGAAQMAARRVSRTLVRAASRPNASSSSRQSPTSSSASLSKRPRSCASATRWIAPCRSGRWRAATCAMSWCGKSMHPCVWARVSCSAASRWIARATSTRRQSWAASHRRCQCSAKRRSARRQR